MNESLNGWEGFFVEVIALLDEAEFLFTIE